MKKTVLVLMCLLLLVSCSGDVENKEIIGCETVRMAFIDSALYRDSGVISELTPRCGTFDGELVKAVEGGEVPFEEHTTNFGDCGYQNATPTSKELLIDNSWVIFERDTITLAEYLGVEREAAERVRLHKSPDMLDVEVDEFYDVAEKIILTNIENRPMQKTEDGVNYEFPGGIYITVNGFDGYAFVSDDYTADRCGMHMSRLPVADYSISKADYKKLVGFFE